MTELTKATDTAEAGQLCFFYGFPTLGWKMAWSDRMVSFYFMTPVIAVVYMLAKRVGVSIRPVSGKVLLLLLLPLFLDGFRQANLYDIME